MGIVLGIAALAIDVSSWYQRHHQAQVVADSAALAAANCLANPNTGPTPECTSTADTSDAQTLAVNYASANGLAISASNVVFNTPSSTVKVTASVNAPAFFATIFNISSSAQSANATASWAGESAPLSLFAQNSRCGTGLGLQFISTGGGTDSIYGLHSNGEYFNGNNSGSTHFFGTIGYSNSGTPTCGAGNESNVNKCTTSANCWKNNGDTTINSSGSTPNLYPDCYPEPGTTTTPTTITSLCTTPPTGAGPTCQYPASGDYWSTDTGVPAGDQITGPGIYCIGSSASGPLTSFSGTCSKSTDKVAGSIYVDGTSSSLTSTSGYEFVGPCVTLNSPNSGTLSGPSGGPIVYGTANTTSSGVQDVWVIGNGATLGSPVFDPLGTVGFTGNNAFVGFVEAQNIVVDKNNALSGNGPAGANQPGLDALTG